MFTIFAQTNDEFPTPFLELHWIFIQKLLVFTQLLVSLFGSRNFQNFVLLTRTSSKSTLLSMVSTCSIPNYSLGINDKNLQRQKQQFGNNGTRKISRFGSYALARIT